jgi:hypothetical protein
MGSNVRMPTGSRSRRAGGRGTARRFVFALAVTVTLVTGVSANTIPARATGPVVFEHVFSDGDPLQKARYEIPDLFFPCDGGSLATTPFVFQQGSYVLLVTASVVSGAPPVVPTVTGKGLSWSLVDSRLSVANNLHTRLSVFEAWADDPDTDPSQSRMTFDFGTQTQLRNSRSFIQSTGDNVDRSHPRGDLDWAGGSGTATSGLSLDSFGNSADHATVLGVVIDRRTDIVHQPPLDELGETNAGASPCDDVGAQHKLGTSAAIGQVTAPGASWTPSTAWQAVALEIRTEDGSPSAPPGTTTTTGPGETTTTTGPGTTTTTAPGETTTTTTPGTPPTTQLPGEPPVDGPEDRFIDDDDSVFEADIETIAAAGITLGCNPPTNNRYCPDDTVTRGQMAAFLTRALNLLDR